MLVSDIVVTLDSVESVMSEVWLSMSSPRLHFILSSSCLFGIDRGSVVF